MLYTCKIAKLRQWGKGFRIYLGIIQSICLIASTPVLYSRGYNVLLLFLSVLLLNIVVVMLNFLCFAFVFKAYQHDFYKFSRA